MTIARTSSIVKPLRKIPALLTLVAASACLAAAPQTSLPVNPDPLAQAITQAADPSSAIQAYATASAAEPGNLTVEETYLRRMVDFGLPEMAEAQAADLTQRSPQQGLPWAVAAYMSAKRGQSDQGLQQLQKALQTAPNDAFALRTAGQMVAWYDFRADKSQLTAETRAAFETVRGSCIGQVLFADAYSAASAQYQQTTATASAPPTYAPQESVPVVSAAPVQPYYQTYPDYYDPTPYYSYDYYPPYGYYNYWWPTYGFVVIDNGFHHDHDHDGHHDGDHDGDRDDHIHGGNQASSLNRGGVNTRTSGGTGFTQAPRVTANPSVGARTDGARMEFRPAPTVSQPVRTFSSGTTIQPMRTVLPAPNLTTPRLSAPSLNGGMGGGLRGGGGAPAGGGGFHGGGGRR